VFGPLSAGWTRLERFSEVLRLSGHFLILEFHDAHYAKRARNRALLLSPLHPGDIGLAHVTNEAADLLQKGGHEP
jgi:hypothetical protein